LQVRGGSGCFDPICYERGIRMRYSVFTIEIEGHSEHIESESKRDVQMFLDKCGFEKNQSVCWEGTMRITKTPDYKTIIQEWQYLSETTKVAIVREFRFCHLDIDREIIKNNKQFRQEEL
jgi:hypothetical protein